MTPGEPTKKGRAEMRPRTAHFSLADFASGVLPLASPESIVDLIISSGQLQESSDFPPPGDFPLVPGANRGTGQPPPRK
jgi:hypothetical protein